MVVPWTRYVRFFSCLLEVVSASWRRMLWTSKWLNSSFVLVQVKSFASPLRRVGIQK